MLVASVQAHSVKTVVVRRGHSKPLWHGHPWVFADAVERIGIETAADEAADWVRVVDHEGKAIGHGWLSSASLLRVRIVTRAEKGESAAATEDDVVARRVEDAVAMRRRLFPEPTRTNAFRLVHAEGDGLPGLVVDRFGPVLVAQFSTRPLVRRRERLAALLLAATADDGVTSLVARPGGKEDEEGIAESEVAFAAGEACPSSIVVVEDGVRVEVDLARGQKTGHYADQRE